MVSQTPQPPTHGAHPLPLGTMALRRLAFMWVVMSLLMPAHGQTQQQRDRRTAYSCSSKADCNYMGCNDQNIVFFKTPVEDMNDAQRQRAAVWPCTSGQSCNTTLNYDCGYHGYFPIMPPHSYGYWDVCWFGLAKPSAGVQVLGRGNGGANCPDPPHCAAGKFSPDGKNAGGSKACSNCTAGTFSVEGAKNCTPCAAGTFSAAGESTCTICGAGKTSWLWACVG